MATIPKNIKKAFAISNILNRVIALMTTDNVDIHLLKIRTTNSLKVFTSRDVKEANRIDRGITSIWSALSECNDNMLDMDELEVYLEYLCMLVPPKDFYDYLKLKPFTTNEILKKDKNSSVVSFMLDLDMELNKLLGTKPYSLVKPKEKVIKVKKVKDSKNKVVKKKELSKSTLVKLEKKRLKTKKKKEGLSKIREIAEEARRKRDEL